jgi:hypothetical protein
MLPGEEAVEDLHQERETHEDRQWDDLSPDPWIRLREPKVRGGSGRRGDRTRHQVGIFDQCAGVVPRHEGDGETFVCGPKGGAEGGNWGSSVTDKNADSKLKQISSHQFTPCSQSVKYLGSFVKHSLV